MVEHQTFFIFEIINEVYGTVSLQATLSSSEPACTILLRAMRKGGGGGGKTPSPGEPQAQMVERLSVAYES